MTAGSSRRLDSWWALAVGGALVAAGRRRFGRVRRGGARRLGGLARCHRPLRSTDLAAAFSPCGRPSFAPPAAVGGPSATRRRGPCGRALGAAGTCRRRRLSRRAGAGQSSCACAAETSRPTGDLAEHGRARQRVRQRGRCGGIGLGLLAGSEGEHRLTAGSEAGFGVGSEKEDRGRLATGSGTVSETGRASARRDRLGATSAKVGRGRRSNGLGDGLGAPPRRARVPPR